METKNCSTCRWGPKCLMKDYIAKWCKEEAYFRWEPKIGEKGEYHGLHRTAD